MTRTKEEKRAYAKEYHNKNKIKIAEKRRKRYLKNKGDNLIYYIPCCCGKMYIGRTDNIKNRTQTHLTSLLSKEQYVYTHMIKCNMKKEDIVLYPLKYCEKEDLHKYEKECIKKFGELNTLKNNYNIEETIERQKLPINKQKQREYYQKNKAKIREYQKKRYHKSK